MKWKCRIKDIDDQGRPGWISENKEPGRIDITTISTIRPDIIKQTFQSLAKYLCCKGGFRLILDVAPVGEDGIERMDVVKVAKDFFPRQIVRLLDVSNQSEAQKWAWSMALSDYVVQWEDDWQLLHRLCLEQVKDIMINDSKVAMIFFDREGKSVKDYPGYEGMFKQIDDNLYQRVKHLNFGGPPALISREYLKWALPYVQDNECLDVTCARSDSQDFLKCWKFYVLTSDQGPFVRDLGKPWMKAHGMRRIKRTSVGMKWVKV
jgi:hypothetical protein